MKTQFAWMLLTVVAIAWVTVDERDRVQIGPKPEGPFTARLSVVALAGNSAVSQTAEGSETKVTSSDDERFFMLNALWFKPDGGADKYDEYLKAAGPFVAKYGGKADRAFVPEANLIGKFDADLVFFVEWPNQKAFTEFIQDPGYQAISHLRKEAIRDSLLIRCKKK